MRCDDSESLSMIEFFQENLCQSASQFRVGARSEFVNQKQCFIVTFLEKIIHILESVAVRTQVIFDRLIVSDIGQNSVKQKGRTSVMHRNQQPTLQHQLQKPNGFEGNTLSSCIRT